MNENKREQELDRFEERREERKKRLERYKTKSGKKRDIHTGNRVMKYLFPVICVLIVLVFALWFAFSTGFIQARLSPLSIGDQKVPMAEYEFQYNTAKQQYASYAQFGMAPTRNDGQLDLDAKFNMDKDNPDITWGGQIRKQAAETIRDQYILLSKAREKKIAPSEEDMKNFETSLDNYKKSSLEGYKGDYSQYLREHYGSNITEQDFDQYQKNAFSASRFVEAYVKTYTFSDEEIQKAYSEKQNNYDYVDYEYFRMTAPTPAQDATEAQKEEAKTELEKQAKAALAELNGGKSMLELAKTYAPETEQANYSEQKSVEQKRSSYSAASSNAGEAGATWLFDQARKQGETNLVENNGTWILLKFQARNKDTQKLPSVRHILLGDPKAQGQTQLSEEDDKNDKALAEEMAAKISSEADVQTVAKEIESKGRMRQTGLLEDIQKGQTVTEFNNWIYDSARKAGDVGVVKTAFGYHIIYFVSWSEEEGWAQRVRQDLGQEKFQEEMKSWREDKAYAIKENSFGMRFVEQ